MLSLQQGLQKLFGLRLLQRSSAVSELRRSPVAERLSGDPDFGSKNGWRALQPDRTAQPCGGNTRAQRA